MSSGFAICKQLAHGSSLCGKRGIPRGHHLQIVQKQCRFGSSEASLAAVVRLRCLEETDDREGIFPTKDLSLERTLKRRHIRPQLRIHARSWAHTQGGERKPPRLGPGTLGTRGRDEQGRRDIVHERNQKPCSWFRIISNRTEIVREEVP